VEVDAAGATQRRPVTTARGYLTAVEATLTFGLGAAERADAVRVRWPGGGVQEVRDVPAGALLVIEQE
jgi:hypothetical protein